MPAKAAPCGPHRPRAHSACLEEATCNHGLTHPSPHRPPATYPSQILCSCERENIPQRLLGMTEMFSTSVPHRPICAPAVPPQPCCCNPGGSMQACPGRQPPGGEGIYLGNGLHAIDCVVRGAQQRRGFHLVQPHLRQRVNALWNLQWPIVRGQLMQSERCSVNAGTVASSAPRHAPIIRNHRTAHQGHLPRIAKAQQFASFTQLPQLGEGLLFWLGLLSPWSSMSGVPGACHTVSMHSYDTVGGSV